MSQIHDLFVIIKQQLKLQGLTYKELAKKLALSEASVKRLFSQQNIDLSRLEAICECINLTLSEAFELVHKRNKPILHLTEKQEKELISDKKLLLVAICVLNYWEFNDILNFYNFSEHELIRKVARLDQMKIIELQPGNRFRRLIHADFYWIADGPIQRFFQENIQTDFFNCRFEKPEQLFLVRNGMLSEQDNLKFQQALHKTADQFLQTCRETIDIAIDKRHGTALVIAMRPWVPHIFNDLKRV
ncbi:helix-turn-helix domain-containing protein [Legionella feeleii]|uniref:Helix-turn-helix n=1 Tax=Legionella feeleii TaxID=453 RepID=A0A0W0TKC3_9GAMM|nr:helix-turn-helix transcriptional regulator [Legionella feeleii]KTC96046.1 helix-turn-helix protein [Legionella feeleii]SPX60191.1 Helix-turn-helix [Legionella feeleii]